MVKSMHLALWEYPTNPQYKWIRNTEDGGITNSAPSIAKDGTIYIANG